MKNTLGRIGALVAPFALLAAVACEDRVVGPVSTQPPAAEAQGDVMKPPPSTVLTGRFVVSVENHESASASARRIHADTGSYETPLGGGSVGEGLVSLRGETSLNIVFAPSLARRQDHWERQSGRGANGEARSIRFTAGAGAPPSQVEFVRGGRVAARLTTSWTRVAGGWRMRERSIVLFRDGGASRTMRLEFGEPQLAPSSLSRSVGSRALSLAAPPGAALLDFSDEGGNCDRQVEQLEAALDSFIAADVSLSACLLGPVPCVGATVAYFAAYRRLSGAASSASACFDGR